MQDILPIFYFPTTVLVVDDDNIMLQMLQAELGEEFNLITASNAHEALQKIKQYKSNFNLVDFVIQDNNDDIHQNDSTTVRIDFAKIIDMSNNPQRQNELSTLVSDYSMPEVSGLELCKQLRDYPLKKILLTGEVNEQTTIEAFNWGIIDRYIQKSDIDAVEKLKGFINEMMLQYFIKISNNVKLIASKLSILSDADFIQFFYKIIEDRCIKEYYLIDSNGSFLLVDKNGNRSVLLITTDEELEDFSGFYHDEASVSKFVAGVKSRQLIPFFGIGANPSNIALVDWERAFYPANHLDCANKKYYWNICAC